MLVREGADQGRGDGLAEGEERSESAAEQDNVVARVDGLGKRVLVGIEAGEDLGEDRVGVARLVVAVKLDELGEQGQDEGEGYLERLLLAVGCARAVGRGRNTE